MDCEQGLMWTGCGGWGGWSLESSSLLGFQEAGAPRQGSALGFLSLECLGKGRRHKGMVTTVMLGL